MPGELWVDFKAVKAAVTIEAVLGHYGLLDNFTKVGDRLMGPCPIHKGTNKKQFSVSLSKGAWKCFSGHCGKSGNVIDLVAAIEGVEFRDAAILLQDWFPQAQGHPEAASKRTKTPKKSETGQEEGKDPQKDESPCKSEAKASGEKVENKPLTFALKLEPQHPYLEARGLTLETIKYFGLGFSNRGSMKGRIAIPIKNEKGELVAYSGRWVGDESEIPKGEGKYRLPPGFHKSHVVFNLDKVPEGTKQVILVEGFFSVFWLHQNGFSNVVSVMGSSVSAEQKQLLTQRFKAVQVFFDGDQAGKAAGAMVASDLAPHIWVRLVTCPDGLQPDRLPAHKLKELLA